MLDLVNAVIPVVFREEHPGFLYIAHNTVGALEQVTAFHCQRHVGDDGVHFLAVFFGKGKDLLDLVRIHIDLDDDAVRI